MARDTDPRTGPGAEPGPEPGEATGSRRLTDDDRTGPDDRTDGDGRTDRGAAGDAEPATAIPATMREAVAVQRERFGGIHWGVAFFGWLSANGLAVILVALLSAAGVATGLTKSTAQVQDSAEQAANGSVDTVTLLGAIGLLVALFLAYYAGGYVAGRMSRFDGIRQGLAVWVIGLVVVVVLAVAGALFGAKYNVLEQLKLPRIPVDEGTATGGGVIALLAILVVTLVAALIGGKAGEFYHRRVDRLAYKPRPIA